MCLRRLNYDRKELERRREASQVDLQGNKPHPLPIRVRTCILQIQEYVRVVYVFTRSGFLSFQMCWCGVTIMWSAGFRPLGWKSTVATYMRAASTEHCSPWMRRSTTTRWPCYCRSPHRTHRYTQFVTSFFYLSGQTTTEEFIGQLKPTEGHQCIILPTETFFIIKKKKWSRIHINKSNLLCIISLSSSLDWRWHQTCVSPMIATT